MLHIHPFAPCLRHPLFDSYITVHYQPGNARDAGEVVSQEKSRKDKNYNAVSTIPAAGADEAQHFMNESLRQRCAEGYTMYRDEDSKEFRDVTGFANASRYANRDVIWNALNRITERGTDIATDGPFIRVTNGVPGFMPDVAVRVPYFGTSWLCSRSNQDLPTAGLIARCAEELGDDQLELYDDTGQRLAPAAWLRRFCREPTFLAQFGIDGMFVLNELASTSFGAGGLGRWF